MRTMDTAKQKQKLNVSKITHFLPSYECLHVKQKMIVYCKVY